MRAITRESLEREINEIELEIEKYKDKIAQLKEEKKEKQKTLKKLENYINKSGTSRWFITSLDSYGSTVKLMDDFESLNEDDFQKYDVLMLTVGYYYPSLGVKADLLIERCTTGCQEIKGTITMSELKKREAYSLFQYIKEEALEQLGPDFADGYICFKKPYMLRAQNSLNRTGYGSIYNGYDLVRQGTLYGETTKYLITKAFVEAVL